MNGLKTNQRGKYRWVYLMKREPARGSQMIPDPETSRWNFEEGKNVWEILRLPQAWPNTNTS
jgi:hypothetical protein